MVEEGWSDKERRGGLRFRLGVLASHAVQYRAPLFRRLAAESWLDLEVLYCNDYGIRPQRSPWGVESFVWDGALGEGYRWRVLSNLAPRPACDRFFGEANPEGLGVFLAGRYDALLLDGWGHLTQAAVLAAARLSRTPLVLLSESHGGIVTTNWRRRLKPHLLRLLFSGVAAAMFIGSRDRDFYLAHGMPADRLFPFPYTVDLDFFRKRADELRGQRTQIREQLGFSEEEVVFLFVGQMIPRKDPLALVEACARLGESGRLVGLLMVGSGPLVEETERLARKGGVHLRQVGFQNQSQLPTYYAAADAFVLPSREETWGLVVNEALVCGLPVVTTTAMGCSDDLVAGRGCGLVVEPGQSEQLLGAMASIADASEQRRQMGERGREVMAHWSYEQDVAGLKVMAQQLRPDRFGGA